MKTRYKKPRRFIKVDKKVIFNPNLSFSAFRTYLYLLSTLRDDNVENADPENLSLYDRVTNIDLAEKLDLKKRRMIEIMKEIIKEELVTQNLWASENDGKFLQHRNLIFPDPPERGYVEIDQELITNTEMSDAALRFYCQLLVILDDDRVTDGKLLKKWTMKRLSKKCFQSVDTTARRLKDLEKLGLISVSRRLNRNGKNASQPLITLI